jgi:uncharacterized protein (TIRG00374 family)
MKNVELGLSNLKLATLFLVLTFSQLFIGSIRLHLLMQFSKQRSLDFKRILSITWASSFINCIAPSALFGEAFKIKELLTVDSTLNKDNSFYALAFSKIFSIISLVIITVVASLFVLSHPHEIQWFLYFLYIFVILSVFIYIIKNKVQYLLEPIFGKAYNLSSSRLFQRRLDIFKQYHLKFLGNRKKVLWAIFMSLSIQIMNTVSFIIIIYAINPEINPNMLELAYVIPLGIIPMILPISISGIGIGHLAFSRLLSMFGITNGADVFTIYFAFSYIFNFIGLIPFLRLQIRKKINEF